MADTRIPTPHGRRSAKGERIALRAQFLLELARGNRPGALAVADSARQRHPSEQSWYVSYSQ